MDTIPRPQSRCGFEALAYDAEDEEGRAQDWCWRCLQPPPYVLEPDYKPTPISSYTVVGGTNIWISTPGIGTYSFDTVGGRWSRAGKWVLPFCGRATYFPEYSSWLGFSPQSRGRLRCASDLSTASRSNKPSGRLLCASDLSTASKSNKPSSVLLLQEEEMQLLQQELELEGPGRTYVTDSYLVHLGSAKFCAAKFFQHEYYKRGEQIRTLPSSPELSWTRTAGHCG
ncbi:hypothetical protein PVAP13_1KG498200 [Panicum virgatum]|uniref:Uncharacterized protein n=2 Tax=Panicum virgatum TaxID=38727 RepID=A0A8T0XNZ9_PANVG|nr:hypothetical protein PVAP13_1KG498200 [Panicum virgatum]